MYEQLLLQQKQWHDQSMKEILDYREAIKDQSASQSVLKRDLTAAERFSSQGGPDGIIDDNTLKIIIIVLLFAMVIIQAMILNTTKKIVKLSALEILTQTL